MRYLHKKESSRVLFPLKFSPKKREPVEWDDCRVGSSHYNENISFLLDFSVDSSRFEYLKIAI